MPFKEHRIKLNNSAGYAQKIEQESEEITGIIREKKVEANKKLPSAELFTIENQIKAGIEMKEVPTTILNTREKMNSIVNEMSKKVEENAAE